MYTGIVEIGQGSPTSSHRRIVAEILGISPDNVNVVFGTTDAPDTGATHASRGTGVGPIGVLVAAAKLRERLERLASDLLGAPPDKIVFRNNMVCSGGNCIEWRRLVEEAYNKGVETTATGYFYLPKGTFDNEKGQGQAYPAYSYVALAVEVEVDTWTGKARLLAAYPALASGRIINPQQVEGQIEGAIVQGLGYVFMEQLVFDEKGVIQNPNLTDYVIPTAMDTPPRIEKPVIVEDPFPLRPLRGKGSRRNGLHTAARRDSQRRQPRARSKNNKPPLTPERLYFIIKEAVK